MKKNLQRIEISIIKFYKILLSPILFNVFKGGCRYEPVCSDYAILSIKKYGPFKGLLKAIVRFVSCNPWSKHPRSYPLI